MTPTSLAFMPFLIVALIIYYGLPRRWQPMWLLLVSYAFCVSWAWQFAVIMLALTLFNYQLARRLPHRGWLYVGIVVNVGALIGFRDAGFFVAEMLGLLGNPTSGAIEILVPIGLSYYILENIAYLLDVNSERMRSANSLVNFALYIAYFPKLLAGPIERANTFLPGLEERSVFNADRLTRSVALILVGAFRKLVIADTLALGYFLPKDMLVVPEKYSAAELFAWLIVYSFYLYNDFAGYTSIVRGISGLFGIELSSNFGQPFFARNFSEFWNRWHITLSHWLRDYIYFPLLRALLRRNPSRFAPANIIIPPLLTMLVSGLWHGMNPHMLVWGGLHGLFQIIERIPTLWGPLTPPQRQPKWRQLTGMVVTFVLITLAWVPFRMELPVALSYWETLFFSGNWIIYQRRVLVLLPVLVISLALDWVQRRDELAFFYWPRLVQASVLAISLFLIILTVDSGETAPFIYQGF